MRNVLSLFGHSVVILVWPKLWKIVQALYKGQLFMVFFSLYKSQFFGCHGYGCHGHGLLGHQVEILFSTISRALGDINISEDLYTRRTPAPTPMQE